MLPRQHRLTGRGEVKRTIEQGRAVRSHVLKIVAKTNPDSPAVWRAACIVGRRVHRSAHVRHKYQRWLRHCVSSLPSLTGKNVDLAIIALPAITRFHTQAEVCQQLVTLFQRIKV